jgi:hypothetical protein
VAVTTTGPDALFLRTGPRPRWYRIGAALWVVGFLALFLYGYGVKSGRDAGAAGNTRAPAGEVLVLHVRQAGEYGIWLESAAGVDLPEPLRRVIQQPGLRAAALHVTGADGNTVEIAPAADDYRTTTATAQVRGWTVGVATLDPGDYRVSLLAGARYADGPASVALAAGPAPPDPPGWVLLAGAGCLLAAAVVALVTRLLRRGAARRVMVRR